MIAILKRKLLSKKRLLHKNLHYLLSNHKIDIKTLSMSSGVPVATITRMKKEDNNPTIATVEPIADFFRIEINDLLYEDMGSDDYQQRAALGKIRYLKVVNLADIKKWPFENDAEIMIGTVGDLSKYTFGIKIDTDSMRPLFYKNSILILDQKVEAKDSDYVLCQLEESPVPVLRQFFVDGSTYFFKPINPDYGNLVMIKTFKILGVVIKSIEQYR